MELIALAVSRNHHTPNATTFLMLSQLNLFPVSTENEQASSQATVINTFAHNSPNSKEHAIKGNVAVYK